MAAEAVRRRLSFALASAACAVGALGWPACGQADAGTEGATFLSTEELAARLANNLVRVRADDLGEQGFGLVIGADAQSLFVLTARHVVARRPPAGLPGTEQRSAVPRITPCAPADAVSLAASWVDAFDPAGEDVALLRAPRPAGFVLAERALAGTGSAGTSAEPGESTWVLGFEQQCTLLGTTGRVEAPADARGILQLRHPGVRGGSSGAPLLVESGITGLVAESDSIAVLALDLARFAPRVRAAGAPWGLVPARNVAPTDPAAARIDLAETLNQYLFAVRNAHGLLLQPTVATPTFADYVARYNLALRRFAAARDKYDGALARHWPPGVLPEWQSLREQLWAVHLQFWRVNDVAATIVQTHHVPQDVVASMRALEPALQALQRDIAHFLANLGQGGTRDEPPPR